MDFPVTKTLVITAISLVVAGNLYAQRPTDSTAAGTPWITQQSNLKTLAAEVHAFSDHRLPSSTSQHRAIRRDSSIRLANHEEPSRSEEPDVKEPSLIKASPASLFVSRVLQPGTTGETPDVVAAAMTRSFTGNDRIDVGVDLYSAPDFSGGLIILGDNVAMKIGGYVKADFIQDFDPIDSTDAFDTTTIPVGADPRTNSRFHARQTRLSFDTRWAADERTVRIYVEGDFFSDKDRFRLRQAYGEVGSLLVGRTWTTFTDLAAAPATLDFEGSVSAVNRRQALARWTQPILCDLVTVAVAIEDTRFIIETPMDVEGDPRSPSPDFVTNARLDTEWGKFQIAGLTRIVGFQPKGGDMSTEPAWGLNFTGAILLTDRAKAYYQVVGGEGIGSYRDLPDAAPTGSDSGKLLPLFGWMVGLTQEWNDRLSSNFTYAENKLNNTPFQAADNVHETTYLAANLIWNPLDRVTLGIEYLYGTRQNVDRSDAYANRLQAAFIFDLP